VTLHRDVGDPEGARPNRMTRFEERRAVRTGVLGAGTLACPECDAPVALGDFAVAPADGIGCPYCFHTAAVRDFLSLAPPTRPARVQVRVVLRPR
jgi:hypothetical protein